MIDQQIIYERNLTGSYMKIAVPEEDELESRILFQKKRKGLLSVQRYHVDGEIWYCYDISGKQSLDTFCSIKAVNIEFIERLIVSICDEIELLEWNLLDQNSLLLTPETIFIGNINHDLFYTVHPEKDSNLSVRFQQLMEYLLTKIDHRDGQAVQAAYEIYEKTLDEAYGLMDLRESIWKSKAIKAKEEAESEGKMQQAKAGEGVFFFKGSADKDTEEEAFANKDMVEEAYADNVMGLRKRGGVKAYMDRILQRLTEWKGRFRVKIHPPQKRRTVSRKNPNMSMQLPPVQQCCPEPNQTICLSEYRETPQGILIYEGGEKLNDIRLGQGELRIGTSPEAEVVIPKNTVSHMHAKITCLDQSFILEDMNSTNGTYVNEEVLAYKEKRSLKMNDIVRFADVRYRFL